MNKLKNAIKSGLAVNEIGEGLIYVTSPDWVFGLEDDNNQQFGVVFEITDMDSATGEPEFEHYPFVVSASIVANNMHESFAESDETDKLSLILDGYSYMGGVPIDHVLTGDVKSSIETKDAFTALCDQFTISEATVKTVKHTHGTVAAQRGAGYEFGYLQFKDEEAARKMVNYLIDHRVEVLSIMIGFILDRPINMMGVDGWSNVRKMVEGK